MVKERVFVSTWSDAIMNDVLFCPTNHVTAIIREDNLRPYLFNTEIMLFSVLIWGGGVCPQTHISFVFFSQSAMPSAENQAFASQGGAPGTRSAPCYQDNPKQTPPFITCQGGCRRRFMSCRVLGDSVHALENTE